MEDKVITELSAKYKADTLDEVLSYIDEAIDVANDFSEKLKWVMSKSKTDRLLYNRFSNAVFLLEKAKDVIDYMEIREDGNTNNDMESPCNDFLGRNVED